jgi:hypothetical protein
LFHEAASKVTAVSLRRRCVPCDGAWCSHPIPPLAQPFIETALNQAPPPHDPGSYPFVVDRWTPDKVYSGAYKAWALTPDELILYMPDYPVGHDEPINFSPGLPQWYMDGGTVQAHIPLSALGSVLRI